MLAHNMSESYCGIETASSMAFQFHSTQCCSVPRVTQQYHSDTIITACNFNPSVSTSREHILKFFISFWGMIGRTRINLYKSLLSKTIPKSSSEGSGNYFRLIWDHLILPHHALLPNITPQHNNWGPFHNTPRLRTHCPAPKLSFEEDGGLGAREKQSWTWT